MSVIVTVPLGGPGYYRDVAVRGNTLFRQYQCKTSAGAPVSLVGYVVRWRGVYGDTVLEKSTADGSLSVTTPANGTIGLLLTPTETRQIPHDENMKYELEVEAPDASQMTILWGDLVGKSGVNSD
jgi:hypothetical protein